MATATQRSTPHQQQKKPVNRAASAASSLAHRRSSDWRRGILVRHPPRFGKHGQRPNRWRCRVGTGACRRRSHEDPVCRESTGQGRRSLGGVGFCTGASAASLKQSERVRGASPGGRGGCHRASQRNQRHRRQISQRCVADHRGPSALPRVRTKSRKLPRNSSPRRHRKLKRKSTMTAPSACWARAQFPRPSPIAQILS